MYRFERIGKEKLGKTIQEKKALLPVIGTVLCLTHDELRQSSEQLDKSGRVIDSVQNSLLGSLNWK